MLWAAAVPILAAKCLSCHDAESKAAGLDLTSRESMMRGGASGPAIVAGKPEDSRLFRYVKMGKMPPARPLSEEEVEAVRQWISAGTPWDAAAAAAPRKAGLDWWALQPPVKPTVPPGAANPIDAFVRAKLREKHLAPATPADHRTLIRRLWFDMTGLPPKPSDFDGSYEQAVERVLESPHYGERWGRYWLDIVRFGESDGGEHNNERMTAWKYRDWVIGSLNADIPYDRFIREQIAGDVIAPGDPKRTAATGFLVCGPWDSVTKQINRDPLFRKTSRQDELDDMVVASTATFLGLTAGCARCHDHKFDPIPQRDYYRLTAAFRGITFGERDVTTPENRKAREAALAPLRKEMAAVRKQLAEIEDVPRTRLLLAKFQEAELPRGAGAKHLQLNPIFNRNRFAEVTSAKFRLVITAQDGKTPATLDRFELLPAGRVIENWKAPAVAADDAPQSLEIAFETPATVNEIRFSTDRVRGTKEGSVRVYRFEFQTPAGEWKTAGAMIDHEVPAEVSLPSVSESELSAVLEEPSRKARANLLRQQKEIQARMDAVPPLDTVHAAKIEPEMEKAYLLERGSVATPREEVTPGALSAIRALSADLPNGTDSERRLALANWLADRRNPLTARVIVNRVWLAHFGNGIVNTPSDFGFNGDRPSHPELLDWLAVSFMENGWSLKWLHRRILLSETYRQSSAMNPAAHRIDASNRLLWRMPLKRMDAETLRDTILAVAGSLDTRAGGPSFLLQKKETKGSYIFRALDNDGPEVWRRGVYKFVARGGERVFLDSFDCPDPAVATPQRSLSNTPVQALTLLNNAFVLKQAGLLAQRASREPDSIGALHRILFQRDPSQQERELGQRFADKNGFDLYCRALLNSNEFVYVP